MPNENNSSAPLKTAGEPFVALGECIADQVCMSVAELPDRNSPPDWPQAMLVTSDELRNIVLDAINYAAQAVAAQPPAEVAVALAQLESACERRAAITTVEVYNRLADLPGMSIALLELDVARGQARAALAVTPALPATEDSSAGDLATESVLIEGVAYTIPEPVALELLRLHIELPQAEVQAEPVDWDELPEDASERAMFDRNLDLYGGDPRVAIATALRLWANTRGNGSFGLMCAIYANEVAKMHITAPQAQPADALDAETIKKAARYDWLRDNHVRAWNSRLESTKGKKTLDIDFEADGHDLDSALDAAMAAAQEGGNAAKEA
ncbi:hypothetical protein WH367_07105 [Comamonas sp. MYb21]|uniref:hypothetical protein n=1 Tax=Comamonas sp. MYb21 TaxID=1848648 RepID=UPI0030A01419